MTGKQVHWILLAAVSAVCLYFTARLSLEMIDYFSLKGREKAQILKWETVPLKDRVCVRATYRFEFQNQTYQGMAQVGSFLNEWAAVSALKQEARKEWFVWFNPKKPTASSLSKNFPLNLCVRSVVCYAVLLYFFYLYKNRFCV